MATVSRFEDLEVWRLSRKIVSEIYKITSKGNFKKDFALRDQIRRSAIGILSNIAEGFESGSDAQFARYLKLSKGSAGECRAQLYVALDQCYITDSEFKELQTKLITESKKLSRLISYLKDDNQVRELEIIYR